MESGIEMDQRLLQGLDTVSVQSYSEYGYALEIDEDDFVADSWGDGLRDADNCERFEKFPGAPPPLHTS